MVKTCVDDGLISFLRRCVVFCQGCISKRKTAELQSAFAMSHSTAGLHRRGRRLSLVRDASAYWFLAHLKTPTFSTARWFSRHFCPVVRRKNTRIIYGPQRRTPIRRSHVNTIKSCRRNKTLNIFWRLFKRRWIHCGLELRGPLQTRRRWRRVNFGTFLLSYWVFTSHWLPAFPMQIRNSSHNRVNVPRFQVEPLNVSLSTQWT